MLVIYISEFISNLNYKRETNYKAKKFYLIVNIIILLKGAMMTVDESLMCSFQILKPNDKK